MNISTKIEKSPDLPGLLSLPFKFIPTNIHSRILVTFLNKLLKEEINEGDLDFLDKKSLCINVLDANIKFNISLIDQHLVTVTSKQNRDIIIQANVYDFLQLAARQQDPDTLVFQRRLIMQGNTELGLELKNFLDGLDLESKSSFSKIEALLLKSLPIYKRLFK